MASALQAWKMVAVDRGREVLGVKNVEMTYEAEGKKRSVRRADIAEAEIQALAGQGDEDITVNNHPLRIAPRFPAVVARSAHLTYRDHGLARSPFTR